MKQRLQNIRNGYRSRLYGLLRKWPFGAKMYLSVRRQKQSFVNWWRRNNVRYGLWWRLGNGAAAVLMIVAVLLPIADHLKQTNDYKLTDASLKLVGHTDPALAKQLTYDASKQLYQFNKDAITNGTDQGLPAELQKTSIGASDKSNAKTYALDVPEDFSKGVTYHDSNSQLSFSMVPQFSGQTAKTDQGHIVFPLGGGNQAVYTLKNNGLKEDILVPEATQDTMSFSYKLDLPKTLQAKVIPNSDGAIGIYSADPTLFGDISYGSDSDRVRVEQAREKGDKTTLVFGLPAPVVKAADDKAIGQASARFVLEGDTLSVVAEHLLDAKDTPITIDPSVVVTSTSDFQTGGNNEGMIDFSTSGQITRGGLTGGSYGSWTTTNDDGVSGYGLQTVAYNGYIYRLGGYQNGPTYLSTSTYAAINSNGTLGTWSTTTALPGVRAMFYAAAYNGYMYITGGQNAGSVGSSDANDVATTYYAPISSGGTIGTWNTTTSLSSARKWLAGAVYNGNMYVMGGRNGSGTDLNAVEYAPFKADGTLGSWTATTSFTTARESLNGLAYNGYLYIMGGNNGSTTYYNDVQYAPINANGTIGTWNTTTSFTTTREDFGLTVYNGYLYIAGGQNGSGQRSDAQYAPINANGTIGTWTASTSLGSVSADHGMVVYNGYLYTINVATTNGAKYAKIDPAGQPKSFGTLTNAFTTARALVCSVAYNGYLYNIGGSTTDSNANNSTVVQYTALNATTGNNGSWNTATSLPAGRGSAGCAAYNGYLYVVGGYTGSASALTSVLSIAINSNGTLAASWTTSGNALVDQAINPGVFIYPNSSGTYMYAVGGVCTGGADPTCTRIYYASITPSTGAVGTWSRTSTDMTQQWGHRAYAQVGKYLYAIGGYSSSPTITTNVEYAAIGSNGALGTWASTGSLNTAIGYGNATTVNGCIYLVGGENVSGTALNNVQYACPAANGTISAWNNAPNLTVATTDMGVTSYNGFLYGVGGWTTSAQTSTQFAQVNNGGSGAVGSWTSDSNHMSVAKSRGGGFAYNGYLYSVGGIDSGSTYYNTVSYAPINANGSLGSWTNDSHTFSAGRTFFGLAIYNGYLYISGGVTTGTVYRTDVQYAPLNASGGGLSDNFQTATSDYTGLSLGREGVCSVAYKGYLYNTGGYDTNTNFATTRYAAINSNGSLGSWADSGNNFTNGRSEHGCAAYNDYLYIFGGSGAANYNDVQYAPINSNGTLGAWTPTTSFAGVRYRLGASIANGFAYVYGGTSNNSNAFSDVQYAPINSNGAIGPWQHTTAIGVGGLREFGSTIYNGNLYLTGGVDGSSSLYDNAQYTPINVISRVGKYSKMIDLGGPRSISSITYNGTLPGGTGSISYRYADSNGTLSTTINSATTSLNPTTCTSDLNSIRYVFVTVSMDDGTNGGGIFADAASTTANVTDITVNYIQGHPKPNIRLRHNQTLQSGVLSQLDTCFP